MVIISNYWQNSRGGGLLTYTREMHEALTQTGINVPVIAREGSDPQQTILAVHRYLFPLLCFLRLLVLKPAKIITHNNWICLLPALCMQASPGKSHPFYSFLAFNENAPWKKGLLKRMLNLTQTVVFTSAALQAEYQLMLGMRLKKTAVMYGGLPQRKKFSPHQKKLFRNRFQLKEDAIVLLMHGAPTHREKSAGAQILIKAMKQLLPQYPSLVLILTRTGVWQPELEICVQQLQLSKQVIFTGELEEPDLAMDICSIYTHITLVEGGVSMSILEAMTFEKPIVATNVGGISELAHYRKIPFLAEPNFNSVAKTLHRAILSFKESQGTPTPAIPVNPSSDASLFNWDCHASVLMKY